MVAKGINRSFLFAAMLVLAVILLGQIINMNLLVNDRMINVDVEPLDGKILILFPFILGYLLAWENEKKGPIGFILDILFVLVLIGEINYYIAGWF